MTAPPDATATGDQVQYPRLMGFSLPAKGDALRELLREADRPEMRVNQREGAGFRGTTGTMFVEGESDFQLQEDILSELAHAEQFQDKTGIEALSTNFRAILEQLRYGDLGRYMTPGTVEHTAHQEIEPRIRERFKSKVRELRTNRESRFPFLNP